MRGRQQSSKGKWGISWSTSWNINNHLWVQNEGGRSQQAREEQTTEGKGEGCGWTEARPVRLALVPSRILWIIYNFISTSRIKCKYNSSRFFRNKSHESSLTPFFHRITGPKSRGIVAANCIRTSEMLLSWPDDILTHNLGECERY